MRPECSRFVVRTTIKFESLSIPNDSVFIKVGRKRVSNEEIGKIR